MIKFKMIVAVLFTIVTAFVACTEKSNIGLGILPEDAQLGHTITDTITLHTITQPADTTGGSGVSKLLIGKYIDPIFGKTEAASALQVSLGVFTAFSDTLIADSVQLQLAYNNTGLRAYGDSTVSQTLKVYRMTKPLRHDSLYYTYTDPTSLHNGELMGTANFKTGNNPDSILRITLDKSWADFFMHAPDSSVYEFGENFRNYFNGFVLVTDDGNDNASIVSVTLNTNTRLRVFYHYPATPDSAREANFPVNEFCARLNMFTHDYSGSLIEDLLQNQEPHSLGYIQAMSGLRMKIEMPYLLSLRELGNIAVYKAEFVVETADESDSQESKYSAIPSMIITGIDENGRYYGMPEYNSETGYQGVSYSSRQYRFEAAGFIQKILNGDIENTGVYIHSAASSQNFNRSVVKGGSHASPVRLIITYSVL